MTTQHEYAIITMIGGDCIAAITETGAATPEAFAAYLAASAGEKSNAEYFGVGADDENDVIFCIPALLVDEVAV